MELPTYTFSVPPSAVVDPDQLGSTVKQLISDELESELRKLERSSFDWDAISGSNADLSGVLQEALQERSRQLSGAPAYLALLNRRARIALLEFRAGPVETGHLKLRIAPGHVIAALEAQSGEWWRMVLERHLANAISPEGTPISPSGLLVTAEHIPPYEPPAAAAAAPARSEGDSRTLNALRRFSAAFMIVPVVLVALILFLFYSWVADVRKEYDDLKHTINVQKQQIIEVVEEGLKKSTDVMDIIDLVKDATLGGDEEPAPVDPPVEDPPEDDPRVEESDSTN